MIVIVSYLVAKRTNTKQKKHLGPSNNWVPQESLQIKWRLDGFPDPSDPTCKTRTEQVHGHDDHLPVFFYTRKNNGLSFRVWKIGDLRHEISIFPGKVGTHMRWWNVHAYTATTTHMQSLHFAACSFKPFASLDSICFYTVLSLCFVISQKYIVRITFRSTKREQLPRPVQDISTGTHQSFRHSIGNYCSIPSNPLYTFLERY